MDEDNPAVRNFLSECLSNDTLTLSEVSETILLMKKRQAIEKKYKNQIKKRSNDSRHYVYINRKQIIAPSYEALIDKLYEMEYGRERSSLSDLYPEWMLWRRDNAPVCSKTLCENNNDWKRYLENEPITTTPLVELVPKDFISIFRKWTKKRQMTRKQFNNIKSVLNGIYSYAIEDGIVAYNPLRDINYKQFTFKPVNNDDDVFTVKDRKKLLSYLKNNDDIYALAIQLAFQLVIRIGELLSLRWTDICDGNLYLHTQLLTEREMNDDLTFSARKHINAEHIKGYANEGYRYQPLTEEAKRLLDKIRQLNPTGEFILMNDNRQLNADTFNRRLKKYCEDCNIIARSSHKIRFCVASILYDSGVPLTILQRLLGHTTTAMTLHYLRRVAPTNETVNLMNAALC